MVGECVMVQQTTSWCFDLVLSAALAAFVGDLKAILKALVAGYGEQPKSLHVKPIAEQTHEYTWRCGLGGALESWRSCQGGCILYPNRLLIATHAYCLSVFLMGLAVSAKLLSLQVYELHSCSWWNWLLRVAAFTECRSVVKFPLAIAVVYAVGYFNGIGSISQAYRLAGL